MNSAPNMMSMQPLIAQSDTQHQSLTLKPYLSLSVDTRTQTLRFETGLFYTVLVQPFVSMRAKQSVFPFYHLSMPALLKSSNLPLRKAAQASLAVATWGTGKSSELCCKALYGWLWSSESTKLDWIFSISVKNKHEAKRICEMSTQENAAADMMEWTQKVFISVSG